MRLEGTGLRESDIGVKNKHQKIMSLLLITFEDLSKSFNSVIKVIEISKKAKRGKILFVNHMPVLIIIVYQEVCLALAEIMCVLCKATVPSELRTKTEKRWIN